MALGDTLTFLDELSSNNTKEWFEAHRAQYERARAAFEDLVAQVIAQFDRVDTIGTLDPKDAIHRIHRDVRFSHDKSPYTTQLSALIGPEGRKSMHRAYYLRLAPGDQSLVSTGAFALSGTELQTIRQQIAADPQPLRAIVASASFRQHFGTLSGEQLKSAPSGFAKDHPAIDFLRYKEFLATCHFNDEDVIRADFVERIIAVCQAGQPLTHWFDQVLGVRAKPQR
ncbi:DUF2461 domain-containing protein [Candidatus Gracilibacteria bacterium]|nr:DUF2461 domain-containing protein [Candidatus Gracilibacteria bacterium]